MAISATAREPNRATVAPRIQTRATQPKLGTFSATALGFMKTPVPTTVPMTMAMAVNGPRARGSLAGASAEEGSTWPGDNMRRESHVGGAGLPRIACRAADGEGKKIPTRSVSEDRQHPSLALRVSVVTKPRAAEIGPCCADDCEGDQRPRRSPAAQHFRNLEKKFVVPQCERPRNFRCKPRGQAHQAGESLQYGEGRSCVLKTRGYDSAFIGSVAATVLETPFANDSCQTCGN